MKIITYSIVILTILSQITYSQCCNGRPQNRFQQYIYSDLPNTPPNSFKSNVETINGFDNFRLGTDNAEPYIATNPINPLNSLCSFVFNRVYYTTDGFNWNNVNAGPGGNNADPCVCYDGLGTVYYVYLIANSARVAKSTDQGFTWTNSLLHFGYDIDKPSLISDQTSGPYSNFVYAIWQSFINDTLEHVNLSRSTNSGVNWSIPVTVNTVNLGYCPWIAIGPNGSIPGGNIYCGYNTTENFNSDSISILVKRSTNSGLSFLNETIVAKVKLAGAPVCHSLKNCNLDPVQCIQMAADNSNGPNRGNVYIIFVTTTSINDLADVYLTRSTNYGNSWSVPRKVNDDVTNTDQWMSSISVDNNTGKIFMTWYDSREDPGNNQMTKLYGAVSTDGGLSFSANSPISTVAFNPFNMIIGHYMGHYIGSSAIGNTCYAVWADGRNNNMGSYAGYYPDFAMLANPNTIGLGATDSAFVTVKIPGVNGPFTDRIRLSASLDSLPVSGNIIYNFIGRDSITSIPDSIVLKIKTVGVTVSRLHRLIVKAITTGNGVPVHLRTINLLVNSSYLNIGTNRNDEAQFKVNNVLYNTQQQLPIANGTNVYLQALSPFNVSAYRRYLYLNWSDGGDTAHNITINSNTNLTAFYKTQFKFLLNSFAGNEFGGTNFYDSLQAHSFGVLARNVNYNGQSYRFRGWNGNGYGSYTSPDSSGTDTLAAIIMTNPISETARWESLIGIVNVESQIPKEYMLYQNYPNPFNPETIFKIDIPKESYTKLVIYDILGREIIKLFDSRLSAGVYKVHWDANSFSSGIYFYKLESGNYSSVKRMVLFK